MLKFIYLVETKRVSNHKTLLQNDPAEPWPTKKSRCKNDDDDKRPT